MASNRAQRDLERNRRLLFAAELADGSVRPSQLARAPVRAAATSERIPSAVSRRYQRFCLLGWIKPNPSPMRNKHYPADVEPYVHAWNHGYHPVGEHHDMHRWITSGTMPAKTFGHPTVKPLAVMDKIMRNLSGRTVIDPFMGTGSTGVAAIRHGKIFTGIELNPKHFATAIERISAAWEQHNQ